MDRIPTNWVETQLHELAELIMGQSPPSSTYNLEGKGLPFFQGKTEFGPLYPSARKYCTEPKKIAQPDDILISVRAPVGPTNLCKEESCIGRGLAALRPEGGIPSKYVLYWLRSIEDWLSEQGTGSTFTAIDKKTLSSLRIRLAPLNEQRRIVEKLDKLLARVDSARARLARIPTLLKRFRQSVLAAAVSGELTKGWREMNPDVVDAQRLLSRICEDRDESYELMCMEAEKADKRKPPRFRQNHEQPEDAVVPEVPDTWTWDRLVNITRIQGGVTKGRQLDKFETIELPYLRVANVQDGYLDLSEIKKIRIKKDEQTKYALRNGDILFTEGGDRDKLGRGTVWYAEITSCIHQNHIFRARPYSSKTLSEYLSLVTKSEFSKEYFMENASQSVNLASINMTNLGNLPVPIAPFEEQKEIVLRVEALFKIIDQIEARYHKAKAHVDKLTQVILAKAFRGELAPQNPNDEPASVLLERIKKEMGPSRKA